MASAGRTVEGWKPPGGTCFALARLFACACMPEEVTLEMGRLGRVTLKTKFLMLDQAWMAEAAATHETVSLTSASGDALLFVEKRLAFALVNAVLGHTVMPLGGDRLSRVERGIFEGVLLTICSGLGFVPGIQFDGHRHPSSTLAALAPLAPFALGASVNMGGLHGWAYLGGRDTFFERAWELPLSAQERVLADLRIELARTRVPAPEVREAGAGDAIVFDETRALSPTDPWRVLLFLGEMSVPAIGLADGTIALVDTGAVDSCAPSTADARGSAAAAANGAQITAELGPPEASPGAPMMLLGRLSLGARRGERLRLRLNGVLWAEGELVTLGSELVVRITKKLVG